MSRKLALAGVLISNTITSTGCASIFPEKTLYPIEANQTAEQTPIHNSNPTDTTSLIALSAAPHEYVVLPDLITACQRAIKDLGIETSITTNSKPECNSKDLKDALASINDTCGKLESNPTILLGGTDELKTTTAGLVKKAIDLTKELDAKCPPNRTIIALSSNQ